MSEEVAEQLHSLTERAIAAVVAGEATRIPKAKYDSLLVDFAKCEEKSAHLHAIVVAAKFSDEGLEEVAAQFIDFGLQGIKTGVIDAATAEAAKAAVKDVVTSSTRAVLDASKKAATLPPAETKKFLEAVQRGDNAKIAAAAKRFDARGLVKAVGGALPADTAELVRLREKLLALTASEASPILADIVEAVRAREAEAALAGPLWPTVAALRSEDYAAAKANLLELQQKESPPEFAALVARFGAQTSDEMRQLLERALGTVVGADEAERLKAAIQAARAG